jgi:hypothetical protein
MREGHEKKFGVQFNYVLGRIKETIYFGFRGMEEH